jgi:hypothetical protein
MTSYEISVQGHVGPELLAALGSRRAQERPASTLIEAELPDGTGLDAVLDRLHGLGLEALDVRRVDRDDARR